MLQRMNLHALPHEQAERSAIRMKVAAVHARERAAFFRGRAEIERAIGIVHHGERVRVWVEGHDPERGLARGALHVAFGEFQAAGRGTRGGFLPGSTRRRANRGERGR